MKIKEVWVFNDNSEEKADVPRYIPMKVITMVKLNTPVQLPQNVNQPTVSQEIMFVLCYHEEKGFTDSIPFTEIFIKEIYDEETKALISIGPPEEKS